MKAAFRPVLERRIHGEVFLKVMGANLVVLAAGGTAALWLAGAFAGPGHQPASPWSWALLGLAVLAAEGGANWVSLGRSLSPVEDLKRRVETATERQILDGVETDEPKGELERSVRNAGRILDHWDREWEGIEDAVHRCRAGQIRATSQLAARLYDRTAQELAATLLHVAVMEKRLQAEGREELGRALEDIRTELAQGVEDVQRAAHDLRVLADDRSNPIAALSQHLQEIRNRTGSSARSSTDRGNK